MPDNWTNDTPIYRQLRNKVARLIMDGTFKAGEPVPSVRQVAAESQINHQTVSRAYQALVDERILEMKRGRGMFVLPGAQQQLLKSEREKFQTVELPALRARMHYLNMTTDELIELIRSESL
jgi:GntR family transcriptional regulator